MRRTAVLDGLDETLVHPAETAAELARLTAAAEAAVLADGERFADVPCPCCGRADAAETLARGGFTHRRCAGCGTLYLSPRPPPDLLDWYAARSPLARFLASPAYRAAVDTHRRRIAGRRADRLAALHARVRHPAAHAVVELAPDGPHLAEALAALGLGPVPGVADPAALPEAAAAVVAGFDVVEHTADLPGLLAAARRALVPGGFLTLGMRSGSGFDVLTLWDKARLLPLSHLTLPTVEGIQAALERHGFTILDLSTPGQLDVQMIERAYRAGAAGDLPRVLAYFFERRDAFARERLQIFLQEALLSSHLVVTACRP
ncbi:hypothetical protein [Azospirillum sp. ST 5-10]|uniref:hypothetical protein n=1 Tax=unclassified Azospirillum TaxID=2630922 RepID=UPI003F49EC38